MQTDLITIRKISLPFPRHIDPVVIEGYPEESFLYIGFSLLLPHLEPYLIRSMREAESRLPLFYRDPLTSV